MGKSQEKNCLPFPPTPGQMAQDAEVLSGLPGDGRVTEEQAGFCGKAVTNLITYQFIFGLPSFRPGFLLSLALVPLGLHP